MNEMINSIWFPHSLTLLSLDKVFYKHIAKKNLIHTTFTSFLKIPTADIVKSVS